MGRGATRVAIYARVSTGEQSSELQLRELRDYAGRRGFVMHREYVDQASGDFARRLGALIAALQEFRDLGVDFISRTQAIDITTPMGRLFFHVIGSFAEFEREMIVERAPPGWPTRAKGKRLGRPVRDPGAQARVVALKGEELSLRQIAARGAPFSIGRMQDAETGWRRDGRARPSPCVPAGLIPHCAGHRRHRLPAAACPARAGRAEGVHAVCGRGRLRPATNVPARPAPGAPSPAQSLPAPRARRPTRRRTGGGPRPCRHFRWPDRHHFRPHLLRRHDIRVRLATLVRGYAGVAGYDRAARGMAAQACIEAARTRDRGRPRRAAQGGQVQPPRRQPARLPHRRRHDTRSRQPRRRRAQRRDHTQGARWHQPLPERTPEPLRQV